MSDPKQAILDAVRKKFGGESAMVMSQGNHSQVKEVIPTGIGVFDYYVMGCGGIPVGRLGEIYAEPGCGKTSFGFAAMAGAQKAGGLAILVETEDALQVERAQTFGVNLDEVILLAPGSMEEALNQMVAVLESIPDDTGPNILVWDSIAATPTKASIEGDVGVQKVGEKARILSGGLPKVCKLAAKKRTALLFINQVREKIGVVFGDNLTTPGGHTVKFHSSWRMQFSSGKSVKDGTEMIGKDVMFISKKNKLSTPFKKAYARLLFDEGWDDAYSTLNFAKDVGAISKQTRNTPKGQLEAREALTKIDKMPWPPMETDDAV